LATRELSRVAFGVFRAFIFVTKLKRTKNQKVKLNYSFSIQSVTAVETITINRSSLLRLDYTKEMSLPRFYVSEPWAVMILVSESLKAMARKNVHTKSCMIGFLSRNPSVIGAVDQ
jgi:hypothetical protein